MTDRLTTVFTTAVLLGFLTACGPITLSTQEAPIQERSSADIRALEAGGQWALLAQEYRRMAATADPPQKQAYLLAAAEALVRGGHLPEAREILLHAVEPGTDDVRMSRQVMLAEIALAEQQPAQALKYLAVTPPLQTLAPATRAKVLQARARSQQLLGQTIPALQDRLQLDSLLGEPAAREQNRSEIVRLIWYLPESAGTVQPATTDGALNGWVDYVRLHRTYQDRPDRLAEETRLWQERYPGHPAANYRITPVAQAGLRPTWPRHIALLLPFDSEFSGVAAAIRDGFLAAYYDSPAGVREAITVRLHNVTPADIVATYQRAVADGADFVVGPLDKQSVAPLAALPSLPVSTLALNYADVPPADAQHFYQFSLSPEDEARQVAERIWLDGHSQGIALVPEGDWGMRVYTAFNQRLTQLGMQTVDVQTYSTTDKDLSKPVSQLLKIDDSRQRHRALQTLSGTELKFESRRRGDIDFVFVVAFPREARQIRPALKFHQAGDLPVYSTSHVFSGVIQASQDTDMDGIIMGDMPWILEQDAAAAPQVHRIRELWPAASNNYPRLFALGMDAYHVLPYIKALSAAGHERFHGLTGSIHITADHRLVRQLRWASFSGGIPKLIQ